MPSPCKSSNVANRSPTPRPLLTLMYGTTAPTLREVNKVKKVLLRLQTKVNLPRPHRGHCHMMAKESHLISGGGRDLDQSVLHRGTKQHLRCRRLAMYGDLRTMIEALAMAHSTLTSAGFLGHPWHLHRPAKDLHRSHHQLPSVRHLRTDRNLSRLLAPGRLDTTPRSRTWPRNGLQLWLRATKRSVLISWPRGIAANVNWPRGV